MESEREVLPSWRPGPTRTALLTFLDAANTVPVAERVAVFDNDGTLWCEKPTYAQFDFFVDALQRQAALDPSLRSRPELAAVLDLDWNSIGELGLERVALALADLFTGMQPHEFTDLVRSFVAGAQNAALDLPLRRAVYQPMLELLDELRSQSFTIFIVTGGGTEFVRTISEEFYGVAPEAVAGTLIEHEFLRDEQGRPILRRTGRVDGVANEGAAKVATIQTHFGRRPILAAGNSGGDREMLEWAAANGPATLALLIDHDDAEREFAYVSRAESFSDPEPITDVGVRLGWTIVSMANDWATVFAASDSI